MAANEPGTTRRNLLTGAGKVAVVATAAPIVDAFVASKAANANGLRNPTEPVPFFTDNLDLVVNQPTEAAQFSPTEIRTLLGAIIGEVAETMGLPRNTSSTAVADKLGDPEFADGRFFDRMAHDSIVEIARNKRRYFAILTMNGQITHAIGRALNRPETKTLAAGIVLYGRYIEPREIRSAAIRAEANPR